MKRQIIYILLIFTLNTFACDCKFSGGFLKTAYYSEYVLKIKIQKKLKIYSEFDNDYFDNGIFVQIEEVLKGSIDSDTLSIFTNPFSTCGPDIEVFEEGSEWFVALNRDFSENQLYFSNCLIDYLKLNENIATGLITINTKCDRHPESINCDTIKKMLNNPKKYLQGSKDCNNKDYYLWVNNMPKPQIEYDSLDQLIYTKLNLKNADFDKCQYIDFGIFIDSLGNVLKIENEFECLNTKIKDIDFIYESSEILKNQIKWIPGNHFDKNLNVHMIYKVDFNEIKSKNEG
jgi:hypothetical protein